MNDSIKKFLREKGLKPRSFEYLNKVIIINTNQGKYVIKKHCNNCDIYNYLHAKGFYNYPKNFTLHKDNYDLTEYISDTNIANEQRIEDLLKTISLLHYKTSYYQEVDLDEIKKIYEDTKKELVILFDYYNEVNDYLEKEIFLSPSEYLLLRNISLIYRMLNKANQEIDEWYQISSNSRKYRTCLIHNNVAIEHLLINDNNYLISWDRAKVDRPIFDLYNFYKKYYKYIKLEDVFNIYEHINKLQEEEKKLLFVYLIIPKKMLFTNKEMDNVININDELLYLNKIEEYIRKD